MLRAPGEVTEAARHGVTFGEFAAGDGGSGCVRMDGSEPARCWRRARRGSGQAEGVEALAQNIFLLMLVAAVLLTSLRAS